MIFCKNPSAETPILEIYDEIGVTYDEYGIPNGGISGVEFANYLKFIEEQPDKKGIDIYINSVGGSIMEGLSMVTAIKSCKLPVNTICVGMAISMAGVILQAGKKRMMVKDGMMMIHPPSGGDAKELKAFQSCLVGLLNARTNLTDAQMEAIMNETSWLDANTCLEMKLIDEVVDITSVANAPEAEQIKNHSSRLMKIVNKLKTETKPVNKNPMELNKIKNSLNLNGDATEAQVTDAIKDVVNSEKKATKAVETALKAVRVINGKNDDGDEDEDKMKALKEELADLKKNSKKAKEDMDKATKDLEDKQAEIDRLKEELDDAKNSKIKNEAADVVQAAIDAGKIKDNVKDTFIAMYEASPEETKALLDGINVGPAKGARMAVVNSKFPEQKKKNGNGQNVSDAVAEGKGSFVNAWRKGATEAFDKRNKK